MCSEHPQNAPVSECASSASVLSMPDNPTVDDIGRLIGAPATALITLWTMQQPEAIQRLRNSGRLTVDPEFSFVKYGEPGKRGAYAWMQEQMQKRLIVYNGELPVWALLSRPTETSRAGDQLVRVQIRKDRMLVCFYRPWHRLLGIMGCLERNGGLWPPGDPAYFAACNDDQRQPQPSEIECRASWEKMFNLSLARCLGFRWSPILLQAMLPTLAINDVREYMPIAERGLIGG